MGENEEKNNSLIRILHYLWLISNVSYRLALCVLKGEKGCFFFYFLYFLASLFLGDNLKRESVSEAFIHQISVFMLIMRF